MKIIILLGGLCLLSVHGFCKITIAIKDTSNKSPIEVVQQQVDAYNARNINDFVDTYADSVKLYNFPDKYLGEGKNFIRKGYTNLFFNNPKLHCEILQRIVQGNTIIDKEDITITDERHFQAVAIYTVNRGKIIKVYFLR